MSDIIQKLSERAAKSIPTDTLEVNAWIKEYNAKFAELIVRECAAELIKWKNEPFPYDPEFGARLIKQHFGVEE
jgi:hypothetical protein